MLLINKRGDNVDEKIRKLDAKLTRYKEQIKKTRPGPAQEAVKARAMRMAAMKSANKELKGMMKTVKIQDIDGMQGEMMDLMDVSTEIQESLGRSYNAPDDIDEEELMAELDALEADMGTEI
ncbi:putative Snf7 family protein [Dioscorea sansibarensis]